MNKKKICMVGDFAVGKTSLTQKFVNNVFSDKYLTTIGVKIDTAIIEQTKLVVWDIAGRDSLSPINSSYLVGAAGVVLVADGTRPNTIEGLADIWQTVIQRIGEVPAVMALNKSDTDQWQVDEGQVAEYEQQGWQVFKTSAKHGTNVAALFKALNTKLSE